MNQSKISNQVLNLKIQNVKRISDNEFSEESYHQMPLGISGAWSRQSKQTFGFSKIHESKHRLSKLHLFATLYSVKYR
jgi:hypothetical protein